LEDGGVVVAAGDVRAHLVLEVAVFGDALKVALLLLVGAHARGAGYAVLRSALLDAPLLSVNFPARSCIKVRLPYVGHDLGGDAVELG
jgi:hypothetical protein